MIKAVDMKRMLNRTIVVYAAVCLLYQILIILLPVREFFERDRWDLFSKGLAVCGALLMVLDLFGERIVLRGRHSLWLFLFIAAAVVSTLVRHSYNFIESIKTVIWSGVQMFLIYTIPLRISAADLKKALVRIHALVSLIFIPAILYMFYQFLTRSHYIATGGNHQGWFEGRLFGIMCTLYFGTIFTAILMFVSVYLFGKTQHKGVRMLYGTEILICLVYIALSDTRTVYLGCAAGITAVFAAVCGRNILRNPKGKVKYILYSLLLMVLLFTILWGLCRAVRRYGMELVYRWESGAGLLDSIDQEAMERFLAGIDRPKQATVTSRRVFIWKSYYEIMTDRVGNLIFGLSPGGADRYIREHYPDQYVVTAMQEYYPKAYLKGGVYDTHNSYLQVVVTTGIPGICVLIVYLVCCAADAFRYVGKGIKDDFDILCLSLIVMLLAAVFFERDVFLRTTAISFIFWNLAGYLMNGACRKEET